MHRHLIGTVLCALAAAATLQPVRGHAQDAPPPWMTNQNPNAANANSQGQQSGSQPGLGPSQSAGGRPGSPSNPIPGRALAAVPQQMQGYTSPPPPPQGPSGGPPTPTPPLGLIQPAWETPHAHIGPGQTQPGLRPVRWRPGITTTLNTREGMLTTILLPSEEAADNRLLSDSNAYEAVIAPDRRSISIKPLLVGVDANLNVYGSSGNVYSFYLRSKPWDAEYISDINVPLYVNGMSQTVTDSPAATRSRRNNAARLPNKTSDASIVEPSATNAAINTVAFQEDPSARLTLRPRALATKRGQEYAATANTGNGRIRTDLRIMVPSTGDSIIAPVAAWRDDKFTYLDFGPRAASMATWPVASLVVDKTESPVGMRTAGPNRAIMVVEGIGNVTLRSGSHIVCIQTNLIENDPRYPAQDEPYRNTRGPNQTPIDVRAPGPPPPGVTPAGAGDYDGNGRTQGLRTSWATSRTAKLGIKSGPFEEPIAQSLAAKLRNGYHGNQPTDVIVSTTPPAQVGPGSYPAGIAGAVSYLTITAASEPLAERLCETLVQYDHTCTRF